MDIENWQNFKMLQPFQDGNKNIDAQPFFPGELRYEGFFLGGWGRFEYKI
jgi:hypothetical protein